MKAKATLIGALITLVVAPALAQSNDVINISGTVDRVDATSIAVKIDEGGTVETFRTRAEPARSAEPDGHAC